MYIDGFIYTFSIKGEGSEIEKKDDYRLFT